MKRLLLLVITSLMILTACGNGNDKNSQSNNKQQEQNSNNVKTVATDQEVQGDNYRTILPFKESQARGVLQDNMANSYNLSLIRISEPTRLSLVSRMPSSA